jgi:hypothetical protein
MICSVEEKTKDRGVTGECEQKFGIDSSLGYLKW